MKNTFQRIRGWLRGPWWIFLWPFVKLARRMVPDETYLRLQFRVKMGYPLDLLHPGTFNEKLQWLKLHNRRPEYTRMVDKIEVKEYVASVIGRDYVIPTLGVWDRPEEIDFDALPDRFVLKTSHGGGAKGVVICMDKRTFDRRQAVKSLKRAMKRDIYLLFREWPYKNVPRRVLAEAYIAPGAGAGERPDAGGLVDYKFFCFGGKADCVMLCLERGTKQTKFYFFDRDWNLLRYNRRGIDAPEGFTLPKPPMMERMFDMADRLSQGLPFARIDLYNVDGRIYFGEITFYPSSGFDSNLLPATDACFGRMIHLNSVRG